MSIFVDFLVWYLLKVRDDSDGIQGSHLTHSVDIVKDFHAAIVVFAAVAKLALMSFVAEEISALTAVVADDTACLVCQNTLLGLRQPRAVDVLAVAPRTSAM